MQGFATDTLNVVHKNSFKNVESI